MKTSTSKIKKTIIEIIAIVVVSSIIALVYNMQNPKGVALIYKKTIIKEASSEELFDDSLKAMAAENDSLTTIIDDVKSDELVADTTTTIDESVEEATVTTETAAEDNSEETDENVADYKNVTYENMLRIVNNPDFIVIDARREETYLKAHIPGALNIFPYDNTDLVFEKSLKLPDDKKIVVYCEGGDCDSSHMLVEFLLDVVGLENVYLYNGGWDDWDAHQTSK